MNKPVNPKKTKKATKPQPLKIDDMLEQLYKNRPKDLKTHIESLNDNNDEIPEADAILSEQSDLLLNHSESTTNLESDGELINSDDENQIIIHDKSTQDQHQAIIEAALFLAGQNGLKIYEIKRMLVE